MKTICLFLTAYNEVDNIEPMFEALRNEISSLPQYHFTFLVIDNCSTDGTQEKLRAIATQNNDVRVIFNKKNFGFARSFYHGFLQTEGDATIYLPMDFQEPLSMIKKFIAQWEEGYPVVVGVKTRSKENALMYFMRSMYYRLQSKFSEDEQIRQFACFGLYDREFRLAVRGLNDPAPYFRGLITELGFSFAKIEYTQQKRKAGVTKMNFYILYDFAMSGFVNHSKLPLRLATFIGLICGGISFLFAMYALIMKLIFWNDYQFGIAGVAVGLFFFASVQLFFLGIIGEYIGAIFTQVKNRPQVFEQERLNFPTDDCVENEIKARR